MALRQGERGRRDIAGTSSRRPAHGRTGPTARREKPGKPYRLRFPCLQGLLLAVGLQAPMLSAQAGDTSPHSDVRLVSEVKSLQPGTPFTVAVWFQLEPGWHNYWRNPGDSGIPTTVSWQLPEGFQAGPVQWPIPHRIEAVTLTDYGYSGDPALLVEVTPPSHLPSGRSVTLKARVDWLVCADICLPAHEEVSLELPVGPGPPEADPRWESLFARARAQLPRPVEGWKASASVADGGYLLRIWSAVPGRRPPDSVYFFPFAGEVLDHAKAQVHTRQGDTLVLHLTRSIYASRASATLAGILLDETGGFWDEAGQIRALEVEVPVEGAPPAETGSAERTAATVGGASTALTLVPALLFAFLGGLLLNLMPCVFPVLSLKILGVAGQAGAHRSEIRRHGALFALGVMASFLLLAAFLVLLKAGGKQLGWGFQLQSPLFVAFMASLFFAIGLNLMGVFEVGLALTRVGSRTGAPTRAWDSFATGVLATVIATPCTAPFMGAALGFALARPSAETFLVFSLLGLGMALPYLVLSWAPAWVGRLPRPGPWMESLKQALAFPMFATVIWLLWVFGLQTGMGGTAYLLVTLLLLAASGWLVGRWHRTDLKSGRVARAMALLLVAVAGASAVMGSRQEPPTASGSEDWQPFSREAVERTVGQGRPVFVDFTAAWCLTCQVNKRLVLTSDRVKEAFRTWNVALFRADWTRQDPHITEALAALGRGGVPVYVLYKGGAGAEPHLLPTVLTEEIVLSTLAQVLGGS